MNFQLEAEPRVVSTTEAEKRAAEAFMTLNTEELFGFETKIKSWTEIYSIPYHIPVKTITTSPIKRAAAVRPANRMLKIDGKLVFKLGPIFRFLGDKLESISNFIKKINNKPKLRVPKLKKKLTPFEALQKLERDMNKRAKEALDNFFKNDKIFKKMIEDFISSLRKAKTKISDSVKLLLFRYCAELIVLLFFIAIFDQMRFRNLKNIMNACLQGKWKLFFYLLGNFLRVPLYMLYLSLLTKNISAGCIALIYAIPFFLFSEFRVPFLEKMFSEIFPPEVVPIRTSTACAVRAALVVKRILEHLANKK